MGLALAISHVFKSYDGKPVLKDCSFSFEKSGTYVLTGPNGSGMPRVQKFDTNGHFITKFGSYGKGDGQFVDPEHLTVDSEGNVYVSDRHNNNIQVFKPVDTKIVNATS